MEDCDDEKAEELSSIAAIYPELQVEKREKELGDLKASLEIQVVPFESVKVASSGSASASVPSAPNPSVQSTQPKQELHELSQLPPLRLDISLPKGYPDTEPPSICLSTTPSWIGTETLLEMEGHANYLWEDYGRTMVLFAYIDWIQQAAERAFDLVTTHEQPLKLPQQTMISLLDFDIKAKRVKFEQETFDCGVCLEPKKGSKCHRMYKCGHVFCAACLQDFYNNCIAEGDVSGVKCLDPDCGKSKSNPRLRKEHHIQPSELLQIPIDPEVIRRYVHMRRKKRIEADKSTVYCPRQWCQGPARSSKVPTGDTLEDFTDSDDDEPPTNANGDSANCDRLAVCSSCNYAFCRVCLSGWHGDFVRCGPRNPDELSAEEKATYAYLRSRTVPCPTCSSPAQKVQGCNHMTCYQCHSHFCYLCGAWLDRTNPYAHFNAPGRPCYMRLWELEAGDENDNAAGAPPPPHPQDNDNQNPNANAADEAAAAAAAVHLALDGAADPLPAEPLAFAPPPHAADEDFFAAAIPPPVPAPGRAPARRHNNRNARGPARRAPVQHLRPAAPPAPPGAGAVAAPAAAAAGNNPAQRAEGAVRALREGGRAGLARFLAMVQNDEEDGWDSDELSEDEEEFEGLR